MRDEFVFASVLSLLSLAAGCDCSGPATGSCSTSDDCRAGEVCVDGTCRRQPDGGGTDAGGDLDATIDAPLGACRADSECGDGESCVGGTCCTAAQTCGSSCCAAGATCFAGACVVVGDECRTSADCGEREYCEPALGPGGGDAGSALDGGVASDAGRACTAPTPRPGRCVALPPTCPSADAGVDGGTGCVASCEYRPEVGMLSAEVAWDWGHVHPPPTNPNFVDVWSTPTVGRLYDANCDGAVDELDPPNVVFVSGRSLDATTGLGTCCQCTGTTPSACHTGVLRVLDGRTGETVWSLRAASSGSAGFAGTSLALGDVDANGSLDIVALTGEGYVVLIGGDGTVLRTSDQPVPSAGDNAFGWGGGLAIADMEGDGFPEIAFGATVFTTTGGTITRAWTGTGGMGGGDVAQALSTFADLDEDGDLELVAGRTAYRADGSILWDRSGVPDGFPAVADLDGDRGPEVIVVGRGGVTVLDGPTGATKYGPFTLPGTGSGGPPTIADFDGDGAPEIGVAQQNRYTVLELQSPTSSPTLVQLWSTPNHDLSSSVTGSTVFDFEGDGVAEVVYADECFLWVFDGPTGAVRYAAFTSSFTGTEASVVADVDGDGHAEIVLPSNSADPSASGWRCMDGSGRPSTVNGVTWVPGPAIGMSYRGVRVLRDPARTWVGTRPIWNQHTYHVTNVCVPPDGACDASATYGAIPRVEQRNWELDWLNNFRQNVQESGLFDAPDATLVLEVRCSTPVTLVASVRNLGAAILPPNVQVDFFRVEADGTETPLGTARTSGSIFPGALEQVTLALDATADPSATYRARIVSPDAMPTFRECRADNDDSNDATGTCIM